MGCCEAKEILDITDNETENKIREIMYSLEVNNQDFQYFDKSFYSIFSLSILDIDDSKWYSHEKYGQLLDLIILNNFNKNVKSDIYDESLQGEESFPINRSIDKRELITNKYNFNYQQNMKNYEKSFYILKPDCDKKHFPLYILYQIIPFLKESLDSKIELLEKAIRFHCKILSVGNFKKFLFKYLEVSLVLSTQAYVEHINNGTLDEKVLVNNIFTKRNIEFFSRQLITTIEKIILKSKPLVKDSSLENEFVSSSDIKEFFYIYKILLDPLELRKYFFSRYSTSSCEPLSNKSQDKELYFRYSDL